MKQARWYSQPFPPAGSISAEGIKRTLGKPPIPWPAILIRESAQNSWDARVGGRPVGFTINLSVVPPQNANAWRTLLLEGAPHSDKFPLRQILRGREWHSTIVRTLTVSDRGTKGLGGPTRADIARGDEPRDWVSFVLNVGDPPDTKRGGGTYGYGKSILYQMSRAGTILVHTRTPTPAGLQNRLIGICLGESMEIAGENGELRPYTGRHWWGDAEKAHVEPLVGVDAEMAAKALGLQPFDADESGTDVIIVEPDLGDQSDDEAVRYLADAIAWNLWPILLEQRGTERMVPRVWHNGLSVPVPIPEKTRGLKTFVAAYRRLQEGDEAQTLLCGNPKKQLGRIALERQLIPVFEPPAAAQDLGITSAPHHVCLMRAPELVVKYHAGPEPISANLAYAGVFKALDDMDRTYAAAEPPTHDDWVFTQLEGLERTFVRTTFTRIKERLAEFARPAEVRSNAARAPLGAVSNFLGSLVAAATGTGAASALAPQMAPGGVGAERGRAEPQGNDVAPATSTAIGSERSERSGRERVSIRLDGDPYFEDSEIGLLLVQDALVVGNGHLVVQGTAGIMVADGSREQEPPDGFDEPVVLGWRYGTGERQGDELDLSDATAGQRVALVVQPVPDTITQMDISVLRAEGKIPHGS
ncbi:hypothetical protein [Actinoplanes regularis]|uniref:Uncharacterized protein n=1 Tax=Actinoplanes regularis TaxID=52697 RepID=A0A239AW00_9ACTN|nr:hypothetical protein [Actinoplanes regularis]GIE87360.1 hypothetical protein Are01nite_38400 [Actinoplanes regularis]SNR99138.1 hypothetical protein SAMN06264365_108125 [Actinoplanes regularis]